VEGAECGKRSDGEEWGDGGVDGDEWAWWGGGVAGGCGGCNEEQEPGREDLLWGCWGDTTSEEVVDVVGHYADPDMLAAVWL
jgi:hypothetical protein